MLTQYLGKIEFPSASHPLEGDRGLESLCFFFANYVNVVREEHTNIFMEHILPLYNNAAPDSALRHATLAAASNVSELWRMMGAASSHAQTAYGKALLSLRDAVADPAQATSNEVLASIFMLDWYEALNRRFQRRHGRDLHQKAAIAIIRQRGLDNFEDDTSRRLLAAIRMRHVLFNLQARKRIEIEEDILAQDVGSDLPSHKLEAIMASLSSKCFPRPHLTPKTDCTETRSSSLVSCYYCIEQICQTDPLRLWPLIRTLLTVVKTDVLYDAKTLVDPDLASPESTIFDDPPTPVSLEEEMTFEDLLDRSLKLNNRLDEWRSSLPLSWQPYRTEDADSALHYSIRAVGLYNGLCDIYASCSIAHVHNSFRAAKIMVLRLIDHAVRQLDEASPTYAIGEGAVIAEIQNLADDICATAPFFLGSRTAFTLPHEHAEYPPIPEELRDAARYLDSTGQPTDMTEHDHARMAAATGGWFLIGPLMTLIRYSALVPEEMIWDDRHLEPIQLRSGQRDWIARQAKRVHKIYLLPWSVSEIGSSSSAVQLDPIVPGRWIDVPTRQESPIYSHVQTMTPGSEKMWTTPGLSHANWD